MRNKQVPAFLQSLFDMVSDGSTPAVRWDDTGRIVQVVDLGAFVEHVLPKYFKHANFSSFSRQLNFYRCAHVCREAAHGAPRRDRDAPPEPACGCTRATCSPSARSCPPERPSLRRRRAPRGARREFSPPRRCPAPPAPTSHPSFKKLAAPKDFYRGAGASRSRHRVCFTHPLFQRGRPELMDEIQRRPVVRGAPAGDVKAVGHAPRDRSLEAGGELDDALGGPAAAPGGRDSDDRGDRGDRGDRASAHRRLPATSAPRGTPAQHPRQGDPGASLASAAAQARAPSKRQRTSGDEDIDGGRGRRERLGGAPGAASPRGAATRAWPEPGPQQAQPPPPHRQRPPRRPARSPPLGPGEPRPEPPDLGQGQERRHRHRAAEPAQPRRSHAGDSAPLRATDAPASSRCCDSPHKSPASLISLDAAVAGAAAADAGVQSADPDARTRKRHRRGLSRSQANGPAPAPGPAAAGQPHGSSTAGSNTSPDALAGHSDPTSSSATHLASLIQGARLARYPGH